MKFYSYLWLRDDGTPYYAGKGKGRRAFQTQHRRIHPPKDRLRILVTPCGTEAEAFALEIYTIDLYGRKDLGTGCLRNLTNGGEGNAGAIVSVATRCKMRAAKVGKPIARKGYRASPETRQKQSLAAKHRPCSIAGWNKGISHSDTHRKRISDGLKRDYVPRAFSAATREKMRLSKIGNKNRLGKQRGQLQSLPQRQPVHNHPSDG